MRKGFLVISVVLLALVITRCSTGDGPSRHTASCSDGGETCEDEEQVKQRRQTRTNEIMEKNLNRERGRR